MLVAESGRAPGLMFLCVQFHSYLSCFPSAFQTDEPNCYGNAALHMACHTGQDTVATELVNCGANINQLNYRGDTPLHLAAASTSGVLCLELLINNGADVNIQVKKKKILEVDLKGTRK